MSNVDSKKHIKIISIFYIVMAVLFFLAVPAILILAKKTGSDLSGTDVLLRLSPNLVMNILIFISSIGLLKLKRWARYSTLILSVVFLCINGFTFASPKFFTNVSIVIPLNVVVNIYAIWYLLTSKAKNLISGDLPPENSATCN